MNGKYDKIIHDINDILGGNELQLEVCVCFLQRKWHNETLFFNTVFVLAVLLLMEADEVKQEIIIEWNHE